MEEKNHFPSGEVGPTGKPVGHGGDQKLTSARSGLNVAVCEAIPGFSSPDSQALPRSSCDSSLITALGLWDRGGRGLCPTNS